MTKILIITNPAGRYKLIDTCVTMPTVIRKQNYGSYDKYNNSYFYKLIKIRKSIQEAVKVDELRREGMLKKNRVVPRIIETISEPSQVVTEKQNLIEIFMKCKDVITADDFSKTDPFIVLYVKRYGQWREYGRTETIINCNSPLFVETFLVDKLNIENRLLKFVLYDSDNMNSKDLQKCKLLATTEIDINKIPSESFLDIPWESNDRTVKNGIISLIGVPVKGGIHKKRQVRLSVGAVKIAKKRFFNRGDVFLEISREIFKDTYHPVYRSEVIYKSNSPRWKIFSINAQKLCNGDSNNNTMFQIWDYSTKGQCELKGGIMTTLRDLIQYQSIVKELPLLKQSTGKKHKEKELNVGHLKLYHVSSDEQYSIIDYITSGIKIRCGIGVDFTLSNGLPGCNSLHDIEENGNNHYGIALQKIGSWMFHYCSKIPLFGFGGKLHIKKVNSDWRDSRTFTEYKLNELLKNENKIDSENNNNTICDDYCFEINRKISKIDTLLTSYKDIISMVEPSGPTYFKEITTRLLPDTSEKSNDEFHLVLLVTDGVNNDEREFEDFLLDLQEKPVIIIIAGVGPCPFTPLLHMINRVNCKVRRKLLFFQNINSDSLENTKELYASLSKSIVKYFTKMNIHPKKLADMNTLSTLDIIPETPSRSSTPIMDFKTCCPTCGSQVNISSLSNGVDNLSAA